MKLSFDNPWYLLIIPVAAVFLILTSKFMYTRNKGSKFGRIFIRLMLVILLALALAGISVKFTGRKTTTIYLVDASDSVRDSKSDIVKFVNESAKDKKRRDDVGVIAFGGDTRIEQVFSDELTFSKYQTDVDTGATNLEEAVKMAIAQMPNDSACRIVLVTDGSENEGALKSVAADVIASGVTFEVKKIESNISDEVYVSDLVVPNHVDIGESFNIEVEVESNVATNAVVKLYAGRTLKGEQNVKLQAGTNSFIFKDTQTDEGIQTYKVVIEAEKDTVSVNNEFSAYTNIKTQLPLLIVEGQSKNSVNYCKMLDSMEIEYTVVTPATVPVDMPTLMEYSAVVFIDVFAADLNDGFLDILEPYVKDNGRGFIITGGDNSYALGGYRDTVIEDVAPVYMDLRGAVEIPSIAMSMVIDHSGSMSYGTGLISPLDLAKQSAAAAVDYLREDDYVEVIAFDDTYSRVVPFKNVEDPEEIKREINRISDGGGTSIYPALAAAITDIRKQNAMIKHIILLTDGEDSTSISDYDDLLATCQQEGITVTTVAIGSGCNSELLEYLAEKGGGRCFFCDYNTDLPRIFAQEVFLASNDYVVEQVFSPSVVSNDSIIRDVSEDGMPELFGYIATTPKERTNMLLESFKGDPILCYWQCGLGRSVAWTSDVTGEWSGQYSSWENTQVLWRNIIKYVCEEEDVLGASAEISQQGSKAKITFRTEDFSGSTKVVANVYDDEGNLQQVVLDPTKPGVYETIIDTDKTGIYSINIQQKDGEEIVSAINTAAIMQYSLEYRFVEDSTLLEEFCLSTGAFMIDKASEVFEHTPEFVKARFALWIPLLIIAALLLLYDIAFRRFQLAFGFINKNSEANARKKAAKEAKKRKEEADSIKEMDSVNMASTVSSKGKNKNDKNTSAPVQPGQPESHVSSIKKGIDNNIYGDSSNLSATIENLKANKVEVNAAPVKKEVKVDSTDKQNTESSWSPSNLKPKANQETKKDWNPSTLKPQAKKESESSEDISKKYQDILASMPKSDPSAEKQGDKVKTRVWVRDDD